MSQHGGFIRKRVVPVFIHEHYRFTSEFYFLKILYGILHYMLIKRSQSDETIPCHSSFCRLERGSCTGTWSSSSLRAMRNTPPGTTWLSLDHSVTLRSALFTRSNLIGSRGFVLFFKNNVRRWSLRFFCLVLSGSSWSAKYFTTRVSHGFAVCFPCRVPEDRVLEKILSDYVHPTESDPVKRQK